MPTKVDTIHRSLCPLTGMAGQIAAELPYTSPLFANATRGLPSSAIEGLRYTLFYNPSIDFYWQETLPNEIPFDASETPSEHYSTPDLPRFTHATEEAILFRLLLKKTPAPKVFDFGMGEGWWLRMMLAYGMDAHGFDTWPHAIDICKKYGITHQTLENYPDNFFDIINAQEVFEHLPNPLQAAQLIYSKLRSGGFVKISTPGDKKIKQKLLALKSGQYTMAKDFDNDFDSVYPLQHINLFSSKSMRYMLSQAGFSPAKVSLGKYFQATTGMYSFKQLNRMFYNPLKRHRAQGTLQLFTK